MPKWLKKQENEFEWCVTDLRRGYRICKFNDAFHTGPHVHFPIWGPAVWKLDVHECPVAEDMMKAFAKANDVFDLRKFQELVKSWKL